MNEKLSIAITSEFKSGYKLLKKRHKNLEELKKVVDKLSNSIPLEAKYRDHALTGNRKNDRECHIEPDWLLVYRIDKKKLILILLATGTHSDLF